MTVIIGLDYCSGLLGLNGWSGLLLVASLVIGDISLRVALAYVLKGVS